VDSFVLPAISGIASCLSCHDGNVSKGAMMMNQSYEQQAGLLPNGNGKYAVAGALYGTRQSRPCSATTVERLAIT